MKNKPLVLVVEDNQLQSDLIIDIIRETGLYQPLAAYNGEEAFDILKSNQRGFNFLRNKIECILLDWQMPKMNGEQFIKQLRADENRFFFKRHIPVVIISAYDDKERRYLAQDTELGLASGYITKPFEEQELRNILSRIVYQKEAEILRELLIDKEFKKY